MAQVDGMTEGLWSIAVFVAGGLSFVAYYHPRQYGVFAALLAEAWSRAVSGTSRAAE